MATPNPHPTRGRRELVSWRLYRVLTGLALVILIVAALAVQHITAPPPPDQLATASGSTMVTDAVRLDASEQEAVGPCCGPGSAGELGAASDIAAKLTAFDPKPRLMQFAANLPWRKQPVPMINVLAYKPGTQPGIIAVLARRDGVGAQPVAGSAMLIELGRVLAPLKLRRGVVLVSSDGGTSGGQGAADLATNWPLAGRIVAAVTIESIAGPEGSRLRLLLRSQSPRGTSPTLVAATRQSITLSGGEDPGIPGSLNQLTGYAVPYAPTEQSPLISHQIPAVGVTTGGGSSPLSLKGLNATQLSQAGSALATLVVTLDQAPSIDAGGAPVVFAGGSAVRAWLLQTALVMLLLPVLACVLVMVATARRARLPLFPGALALGWRVSTWLVGVVAMWVLTLLPNHLLPDVSAPPLPHRTGVTTGGVVIVLLITALYWRFVSRPRLRRGVPASGGERTIGLTTALLGLMGAAILLAAINPYVLILIVPAAHAWLWLVAAARGGRRAMAVPYAAGFLGLLVVVLELWFGQSLSCQTPRVLIAMAASGYLSPAITFCLAIVGATACQVGALVLGRYGPVQPEPRRR